jgi:hypothetical protein
MMLGLERWNGGWDGLCAPGGQVEAAAAAEGREEELTPTRVLYAKPRVVNINIRITTINRNTN